VETSVSRRIVNVSCSVCNRLTGDHVIEGPDGIVFTYRRHVAAGSRRQLDRYRQRAGGRGRNPAITANNLPLDDLLDPATIWTRPEIECHCKRCGRLVLDARGVVGAITRYRQTGRRQTVRANQPDAS
jgi:ribosomal protein S27E